MKKGILATASLLTASGLVWHHSLPTTSSATDALLLASRASAQTCSVPSAVSSITTAGYAVAGDHGGANYTRALSEPTHEGKLQTADGSWWSLSERSVTPNMFGAIGDGTTDDGSSIQDALEFLEFHGGGILQILPQTYLTANMLAVGNNITIRGPGTIGAHPLLPPNKLLLQNAEIGSGQGVRDATGIRIQNVVFDGRGQLGRTAALVGLTKVVDPVVEGCTFKSADYIGLADGGCLNGRYQRNVFTDLGDASRASPALWIQSFPADQTMSTRAIASESAFYDNRRSGVLLSGIECSLINNTLHNNGESTIFMGATATSCTVTGNHVRRANRADISAHGIEVGGQGHLISDNDIISVDGTGITVSDPIDVVVTNNRISGYREDPSYYVQPWSAAGISVITESSSRNVLVSGNIIRRSTDSEYGIVIFTKSTAATSPVGIQIVANNLKDAGHTGGIHLQSTALPALGNDCLINQNAGHKSASSVTGSFTIDVGAGTQSVENLPFPPRELYVTAVFASSGQVLTSHGRGSRSSAASATYLTFNGDAAAIHGTDSNNKIVMLRDILNNVIWDITLLSLDPDGFTISRNTSYIPITVFYEAHP